MKSICLLLLSFVIFACENNDFKGNTETNVSLNSDSNSDLDTNQNTIPDNFEDPKFVVDIEKNTTVNDLGKLFIPDGEGGYKEVEAIYKNSNEGIVKINETLKRTDEGFFQVDNPNFPNDGKYPSNLDPGNNTIPEGYREATEGIFIKTPEGFIKVDLYEPKIKNEGGGFTDPSNLKDDDVTMIPTLIIPNTPKSTAEPTPNGTTTPVSSTPPVREPNECETKSIDFEDMIGSVPKTKISKQYYNEFGVSFQLSDGTDPELIEHNKGTVEDLFIGWICNWCTEGIPSPFTGPGTLNGVLEKDQKRLGNYSIGGPNKNRSLIVNYSNPVQESSGTLIDVDGAEKWDVIAFDQNNNIVDRITVETKDGNGDGVGTDWQLKPGRDFIKIELKFSLSNENLGGGLALDLFSPAKACEINK